MKLGIVLTIAATIAVASPASATTSKLRAYERQATKHENVLRFFTKHPWLAVPSERKCWQATGWHRRKTCRIARREIAEHTARLENVRHQIALLTVIRGSAGNTAAWLCIHSNERGAAGWATNTGNGYYGGLQMDYEFMSTYGPELLRSKGTADRWTAYEQMVVAQRAHDSGRGYYPWPRTARLCGLL